MRNFVDLVSGELPTREPKVESEPDRGDRGGWRR